VVENSPFFDQPAHAK